MHTGNNGISTGCNSTGLGSTPRPLASLSLDAAARQALRANRIPSERPLSLVELLPSFLAPPPSPREIMYSNHRRGGNQGGCSREHLLSIIDIALSTLNEIEPQEEGSPEANREESGMRGSLPQQ